MCIQVSTIVKVTHHGHHQWSWKIEGRSLPRFLDLVQPQGVIDRGNRVHQRAGAKVCSCSRMNLRNQTDKGTAWTRQEVV
jgi:hypothetical protein